MRPFHDPFCDGMSVAVFCNRYPALPRSFRKSTDSSNEPCPSVLTVRGVTVSFPSWILRKVAMSVIGAERDFSGNAHMYRDFRSITSRTRIESRGSGSEAAWIELDSEVPTVDIV